MSLTDTIYISSDTCQEWSLKVEKASLKVQHNLLVWKHTLKSIWKWDKLRIHISFQFLIYNENKSPKCEFSDLGINIRKMLYTWENSFTSLSELKFRIHPSIIFCRNYILEVSSLANIPSIQWLWSFKFGNQELALTAFSCP